jgi:hypothetical protein
MPAAGASVGVRSAVFVRGCDTAGYGGLSKISSQQALYVGPISLGSLGTLQLSQLDTARPAQVRFGVIESIAVIRAGAAVTIAVPAFERRYVGLLYDHSKFRNDGTYQIRDLDWAVRFVACKDRHFNRGVSQFDGGMVVAGRRCFTLDFYIAGQTLAIRRRIPVHGRCPTP